MADFIVQVLLEGLLKLVRATGTLLIRGLSFGRIRTAPLFPVSGDQTPLIGMQTWDGIWVAGPWISFLVGLLFWIAFPVALKILL